MSSCTYTLKDPSGKDVTLTGQATIKAWLVAGGLRYLRAANDVKASRARDVTQTPEFKRWFGDSKVVDAQGEPLVVYHGTVVRDSAKAPGMGDITAFDRMFTTKFRSPSIDTVGSWFSANPGDGGAEMYSGRYAGSAIYPVYLSIKNPQVTTFQLMTRRARLLASGKDDGRTIGAPEVEAYRKWLAATGKDGVKIEGSGNDGSTEFDNQVAWIALEPEQIKSATGNEGSFSPADPDIRRSAARTRDEELAARADGWRIIDSQLPSRESADRIIATRQKPSPRLGSMWTDGELRAVPDDVAGLWAIEYRKPDIRRSAARPQFISQLAAAIEAIPARLDNMAAPMWQQWLKANAAKLGIKQDEIAWSGIEDYLKLRGKDKVSKAEIGAWLADNGVKVQDEVLGGRPPGSLRVTYSDSMDTWQVVDEEGSVLEGGIPDRDAAEATLEGLVDRDSVGTKYESYRVPGGENYREVLVTLPEKASQWASGWTAEKMAANRSKFIDDMGFSAGAVDKAIAMADEADGASDALRVMDAKVGSGVYGPNDKEARDFLRGLVVGAKKKREEELTRNYKSKHWDQRNVLVHFRADDRTDADGNKVLFLHDLQSDWGQQGKKDGFAVKEVQPDPTSFEVRPVDGGYRTFWDNGDQSMVYTDPAWGRENAQRFLDSRRAKGKTTGVPAAPFVTDTKSWVALGLKRALMMAVEGGYDKVAMVTGEQAAEMFDLSKQVDAIRITKLSKGGFEYNVRKDGQTIGDPRETVDSVESLADVLGKELAAKADQQEPDTGKLYEGLDLKVGGEGMKAFYDQIVPQVMRDVAKKLGGKVVESKFDPEDVGINPDDWVGKVKQPAIEITPEMRDKVLSGVPLFSRQRAFHGTPRRGIEKFSTDFMGSGEGAQSYGWGLYFASKKEVADWYRRSLSDSSSHATFYLDGKKLDQDSPERHAASLLYHNDKREILAASKRWLAEAKKGGDLGLEDTASKAGLPAAEYWQRLHDFIAGHSKREIKAERGQLYGVEIPGDSEMLLWDKPLSEHSAKVQDALDDAARGVLPADEMAAVELEWSLMTGQELYRAMSEAKAPRGQGAMGFFRAAALQNERPNGDKAASEALAAAGIKGIKYLDGTSRGAGDGSFNYVIFDGADVDVQRTFFSRARAQTQTPEFKRWFGDSKVVDANGEPLVVYHGTASDITEFDVGKSERLPGIWMTPDVDAAGRYAKQANGWGGAGPNIVPLYVKLENPRIFEASREPFGSAWRDYESDSGYDGMIVKKHGKIEAVAARNGGAQIKSAIGNNGEFDPANPDITKSPSRIIGDTGRKYTPDQLKMFANVGREVTKPTMKERILALRKDFGKKLTQGIVDQFAPIKDISEQGYLLARLSKGTAGAMEALLHHGKLSIKDGAYDADMSGGFVDRVGKALHGELDDFLVWVAANRAERLKAEGKENLFGDADIAAGKSLATGKTDFDYVLQHDIAGKKAGETTRDRVLIYRDAHKTFNEFQDNVLQMAEESGLIDSEARKLWKDDFYVPFYRVSEEEGGFVNVTGSKGLVRQNAFKKLKGGANKLNDLTANTLMNWSHLIDAAAKNRAAKETLVAAEQMGAAIEAPEATARSMAKAAGAKDQVVWFAEGGKKRFFVVEDPLLMTALTSLEFAGLRGPLMDALSTFKHALTVGVTASPAFKIRNLVRDSLQAIAIAPLSMDPVKNLREGIKASDRTSQTYVSALASGGLIKFGTAEGKQADAIRKLIERGVDSSTILDSDAKVRAFYNKAVQPVIDAYQELGNRGEEINRASLYSQLVKQGVSHAEAALMARDLMDFSLQGSFSTVRFLTQVVPFMNARLQGLYRLGRGAAADPARFATVLGAVTLFSLGLMAANWDDPDEKKREDFDKNNFWMIKIGGTAWRIPQPFELAAISRVMTLGVELFANDEMTQKRFMSNIGALLSDNLAMNPVPQAMKPVLDLYANKSSFTGRPIESLAMQRLDPEYRYNSSTSMVARAASTATAGALSPVKIDHAIQGYFGWLGTFVVGGADMLVRPLTDEPSRPAPDYIKLVTQGIGRELTSEGSHYISNLYDVAGQVETAYATYRQLIKEGKADEAYAWKADHEQLLAKRGAIDAAKKAETQLTARIREIERSDLAPSEKRQRINEIRAKQNEVAKAVPQL